MRTGTTKTHRATAMALAGVVSVCLLVAGCGSSKSSSSPATTSPTTASSSTSSSSTTSAPTTSTSSSSASATTTLAKPSAADEAFCEQLVKYADAANGTENPKTLSAAKKDFATLVDEVVKMVPAAPASLRPTVQAAAKDVKAVETWIDTKATLKSLEGTTTPAAVTKPLTDLDKRSTTLGTWDKAHCQ
jgi:hypothetical protein